MALWGVRGSNPLGSTILSDGWIVENTASIPRLKAVPIHSWHRLGITYAFATSGIGRWEPICELI